MPWCLEESWTPTAEEESHLQIQVIILAQTSFAGGLGTTTQTMEDRSHVVHPQKEII